MPYFIIRVVVNALALALSLTIFPWIDIRPMGNEPLAATYVVLGLLLGLINAFIRPVVLFLTARLVVTTMGLFVIVINAFVFWLLSVLLPNVFDVRPPEILWIIVGSIFIGIVVMVMEAIFGLDSPLEHSGGQGRFYWRWLNRLSPGRRNVIVENMRVAQISNTIAQYTKDVAVDFTPLTRMRLFMQDLLYDGHVTVGDEPLPAKARMLMQALGPTFVKFGQVISSRAGSLPPEWSAELNKLQSEVAPFPYAEARKIIMDQLGEPPEQLYADFEEEPFAAASTAQVHKAHLHDGTLVVVKVQRPDIDVTVKADLNVMRDLAANVQKGREWAQDLDIAGTLNEFADNVLLELDYTNEAFNAQMLKQNMAEYEFVHVPTIYPELSARRVMTQEFVKGVKINRTDKLDQAGVDRPLLARQFIRAMIKQVLFDGFFHADPHPGNILCDLEKHQIIFLDMGMMGNLDAEQRLALGDLIWSLSQRDGREIAKTAISLSVRFKPGDEQQFITSVERMMTRYSLASGGASGKANMAGIVNEMLASMRRAGLRLDPSLTLALKSLFQAEQVVKALDPELSMVTAASEEVKVMLRERFDPTAIAGIVRREAMRAAKDVVRRLPEVPEAANKWLDQILRGRLSLFVDTSDLAKEVDKFDQSLSRNMALLALSLIISGLLVGTAIATSLDVPLFGISLRTLAFVLFVVAAGVATYVVYKLIRRVL